MAIKEYILDLTTNQLDSPITIYKSDRTTELFIEIININYKFSNYQLGNYASVTITQQGLIIDRIPCDIIGSKIKININNTIMRKTFKQEGNYEFIIRLSSLSGQSLRLPSFQVEIANQIQPKIRTMGLVAQDYISTYNEALDEIAKPYNIKIDTKGKSVVVGDTNNLSVEPYTFDTVKLILSLIQDKSPLDITNLVTRVVYKTPDDKRIIQTENIQVIDSTNGELSIIIDNGAISKIGEHVAQFEIYGATTIIHTQMFKYNVLECLGAHSPVGIAAICGGVLSGETLCGEGVETNTVSLLNEEVNQEYRPSFLNEEFLKMFKSI